MSAEPGGGTPSLHLLDERPHDEGEVGTLRAWRRAMPWQDRRHEVVDLVVVVKGLVEEADRTEELAL